MNVTPVESSAAAFLRAESYTAPRFAMLSTFWYDIEGGIAAGQDGMTLASAKNALWDALVLFLMKRRVIYQTPTSHIALHTLIEETIDDSGLIEEMDALLLGNPESHEDVVALAQACLRFIDDGLGMKHWRELYGDFTSWEQLAAYQRRLVDIPTMAAELDVVLPQPLEAITARIQFRTEIEQRVAGKASSGPLDDSSLKAREQVT